MMNRKILFLALLTLTSSVTSAADTATLVKEGNQAWAANDLPVAESKYREAVELDSESAAAHAQLASLLMAQSRNKDAIEAYQEAIIADPENPRLFVGIGLAYLHEARYESASAMVARALALNPDMDNARKLALYIEKKREQIAKTAEQSPELPSGHPLPGAHPAPQ